MWVSKIDERQRGGVVSEEPTLAAEHVRGSPLLPLAAGGFAFFRLAPARVTLTPTAEPFMFCSTLSRMALRVALRAAGSTRPLFPGRKVKLLRSEARVPLVAVASPGQTGAEPSTQVPLPFSAQHCGALGSARQLMLREPPPRITV